MFTSPLFLLFPFLSSWLPLPPSRPTPGPVSLSHVTPLRSRSASVGVSQTRSLVFVYFSSFLATFFLRTDDGVFFVRDPLPPSVRPTDRPRAPGRDSLRAKEAPKGEPRSESPSERWRGACMWRRRKERVPLDRERRDIWTFLRENILFRWQIDYIHVLQAQFHKGTHLLLVYIQGEQ